MKGFSGVLKKEKQKNVSVSLRYDVFERLEKRRSKNNGQSRSERLNDDLNSHYALLEYGAHLLMKKVLKKEMKLILTAMGGYSFAPLPTIQKIQEVALMGSIEQQIDNAIIYKKLTGFSTEEVESTANVLRKLTEFEKIALYYFAEQYSGTVEEDLENCLEYFPESEDDILMQKSFSLYAARERDPEGFSKTHGPIR